MTRKLLAPLTTASLIGGAAMVEADFTATHRIEDEFWVLGGRYSYDLVKDGAYWKVTSMTMTPLWETGDRARVALAGERAAAAN